MTYLKLDPEERVLIAIVLVFLGLIAAVAYNDYVKHRDNDCVEIEPSRSFYTSQGAIGTISGVERCTPKNEIVNE